ncbi:tetratricopeptide repeat protein, partial [Parapusillimonas sp. SGNA-6]|nr:tetratricopeptide repeat protein [Parapusillimonas sp. SGNA-6]
MEEEFEFGSPEEQKQSVDRYEEMIRNDDQYFFDAAAFESIIDYYALKNDPVKALQVIGFAINQHPFETIFLVKQAQIYASIQNFDEALAALEKAELLEPSEGDIYLIRGTIYSSMGWFDDAEENLKKALHSADNKEDVYYQLGNMFQVKGDFEKAVHYLKKSLQINQENQDALYELAFC